MAITTTITDDFADQFRDGVSLSDKNSLLADYDNVKTALYTSSATLNKDTTAYTTTNEVSGQGYTAGGLTLWNTALYTTVAVNQGPNSDIHTMDFPDAIWPNATFTARGALVFRVYASSTAAMAVFDFGGDFTVTNGTFTIVWPPATIQRAAIRVIG